MLPLVLTACRGHDPAAAAGAPGGPRVLWATAAGTWAAPESSPTVGRDGHVYTPGSTQATLDSNGRPAANGVRQGGLHKLYALAPS
jgi:hypothetical protein